MAHKLPAVLSTAERRALRLLDGPDAEAERLPGDRIVRIYAQDGRIYYCREQTVGLLHERGLVVARTPRPAAQTYGWRLIEENIHARE